MDVPESGVCGAGSYLVLPATPARRNVSARSLCPPDGCTWGFRPGLSVGATGETLCNTTIVPGIGVDISHARRPWLGLLVQVFCG